MGHAPAGHLTTWSIKFVGITFQNVVPVLCKTELVPILKNKLLMLYKKPISVCRGKQMVRYNKAVL